MRRLLFAVNTVIAILVLAAVGIFYWVFWRALPQTSGTIATYVTQPVEVDRDKLGLPHIKARTLDDAWFVQGYVTAEDRMFQMDGLRRLAGGDLAEIVGPGALESDLASRKLRLRRIAEEIYTQMPPEDKAVMEAYARGINSYIETHRGRYGFEFTVLGYDPRPWSVVDSLLAGLQMFRTLTDDWKNKMVKQQMLAGGEPDKIDVPVSESRGHGVHAGRRCASGVECMGHRRFAHRLTESRCFQMICISISPFPACGIWRKLRRPG